MGSDRLHPLASGLVLRVACESRILKVLIMGRNLYILGGTLGSLALISIALSFSHVGEVPGTPSDASLWRTTGVALLAVALIVSLAGVLSSLFEQAERRSEQQRQVRRRRKPLP